jgi:hypothetical protein
LKEENTTVKRFIPGYLQSIFMKLVVARRTQCKVYNNRDKRLGGATLLELPHSYRHIELTFLSGIH